MSSSILVIDNFCNDIELVKQSALSSGFGTWKPHEGEIGKEAYDGMNFVGRHDLMLKALAAALSRPVYPSSMFFRVTSPGTEKACVHSDRMHGDWSCIAYMSDHDEVSGTGFYRHKETGLREMPTVEEMKEKGMLDGMVQEMSEGKDEDWERLDFVRGISNRALIFHAPLFHSREPKTGLGATDENGRMVWVSHFYL